MEKYQETFEKRSELSIQLKNECKEYIINTLKSRESHKISFYAEEYCDYQPTVVYDGGRHPEYDSNAYSSVEEVYLDEKGELHIDIEDCSDYSTDSLSADEWYDIAEAVNNYVKNVPDRAENDEEEEDNWEDNIPDDAKWSEQYIIDLLHQEEGYTEAECEEIMKWQNCKIFLAKDDDEISSIASQWYTIYGK